MYILLGWGGGWCSGTQVKFGRDQDPTLKIIYTHFCRQLQLLLKGCRSISDCFWTVIGLISTNFNAVDNLHLGFEQSYEIVQTICKTVWEFGQHDDNLFIIYKKKSFREKITVWKTFNNCTRVSTIRWNCYTIFKTYQQKIRIRNDWGRIWKYPSQKIWKFMKRLTVKFLSSKKTNKIYWRKNVFFSLKIRKKIVLHFFFWIFKKYCRFPH